MEQGVFTRDLIIILYPSSAGSFDFRECFSGSFNGFEEPDEIGARDFFNRIIRPAAFNQGRYEVRKFAHIL